MVGSPVPVNVHIERWAAAERTPPRREATDAPHSPAPSPTPASAPAHHAPATLPVRTPTTAPSSASASSAPTHHGVDASALMNTLHAAYHPRHAAAGNAAVSESHLAVDREPVGTTTVFAPPATEAPQLAPQQHQLLRSHLVHAAPAAAAAPPSYQSLVSTALTSSPGPVSSERHDAWASPLGVPGSTTQALAVSGRPQPTLVSLTPSEVTRSSHPHAHHHGHAVLQSNTPLATTPIPNTPEHRSLSQQVGQAVLPSPGTIAQLSAWPPQGVDSPPRSSQHLDQQYNAQEQHFHGQEPSHATDALQRVSARPGTASANEVYAAQGSQYAEHQQSPDHIPQHHVVRQQHVAHAADSLQQRAPGSDLAPASTASGSDAYVRRSPATAVVAPTAASAASFAAVPSPSYAGAAADGSLVGEARPSAPTLHRAPAVSGVPREPQRALDRTVEASFPPQPRDALFLSSGAPGADGTVSLGRRAPMVSSPGHQLADYSAAQQHTTSVDDVAIEAPTEAAIRAAEAAAAAEVRQRMATAASAHRAVAAVSSLSAAFTEHRDAADAAVQRARDESRLRCEVLQEETRAAHSTAQQAVQVTTELFHATAGQQQAVLRTRRHAALIAVSLLELRTRDALMAWLRRQFFLPWRRYHSSCRLGKKANAMHCLGVFSRWAAFTSRRRKEQAVTAALPFLARRSYAAVARHAFELWSRHRQQRRRGSVKAGTLLLASESGARRRSFALWRQWASKTVIQRRLRRGAVHASLLLQRALLLRVAGAFFHRWSDAVARKRRLRRAVLWLTAATKRTQQRAVLATLQRFVRRRGILRKHTLALAHKTACLLQRSAWLRWRDATELGSAKSMVEDRVGAVERKLDVGLLTAANTNDSIQRLIEHVKVLDRRVQELRLTKVAHHELRPDAFRDAAERGMSALDDSGAATFGQSVLTPQLLEQSQQPRRHASREAQAQQQAQPPRQQHGQSQRQDGQQALATPVTTPVAAPLSGGSTSRPLSPTLSSSGPQRRASSVSFLPEDTAPPAALQRRSVSPLPTTPSLHPRTADEPHANADGRVTAANPPSMQTGAESDWPERRQRPDGYGAQPPQRQEPREVDLGDRPALTPSQAEAIATAPVSGAAVTTTTEPRPSAAVAALFASGPLRGLGGADIQTVHSVGLSSSNSGLVDTPAAAVATPAGPARGWSYGDAPEALGAATPATPAVYADSTPSGNQRDPQGDQRPQGDSLYSYAQGELPQQEQQHPQQRLTSDALARMESQRGQAQTTASRAASTPGTRRISFSASSFRDTASSVLGGTTQFR